MSENKLVIITTVGALLLGLAYKSYVSRQELIKPPKPRKEDHEVRIGKYTKIDPYFWMKDMNDPKRPEIIEHLKKENLHTQFMTRHLSELRQTLYDEFIYHTKEDDSEVPYRIGSYEYYTKTVKGKQYPIYYRRLYSSKEQDEKKKEMVLDVNDLAKGFVFYKLKEFETSPNQKWIAYSEDTTGNEKYDTYVLDIESKKIVETCQLQCYGKIAWVDNHSFVYLTLDYAHRPYQVKRHQINDDISNDELLFEEKDEKFWVSFYVSQSGEYLFIDSSSKKTTEILFAPININANQPQPLKNKIVKLVERNFDVSMSVDQSGDYFYILTNENGAKNFQLMRTPTHNIDRSQWEVVISHSLNQRLSELKCFKDYVVIKGRKNGHSMALLLHNSISADPQEEKDTNCKLKASYIKFPEQHFELEFGVNREYNIEFVRLVYCSFVTPTTVFDYYFQTQHLEEKKVCEVPGYDKSLYECDYMQVESHDGEMVPLSMVFRKDKKKDKNNYVILEGYGAYEDCFDPVWDQKKLSYLDRGVVYVIANIRGGGEKGRSWYENGKEFKKMNTFLDFIAVAEYFIHSGFTSSQRLAICGGSAGGLLMGVVLNMRPELFKACYVRVPFVDVLTTMSDEKIPLTVTEWEEWGNPCEEKYYEYMKQYSPYDNVAPKKYPAILVTSGLNDYRVGYWEPMKWVAKLRDNNLSNNSILHKCAMIQGHGGSSARYTYLEEQAFNYSWVLDQLGLRNVSI